METVKYSLNNKKYELPSSSIYNTSKNTISINLNKTIYNSIINNSTSINEKEKPLNTHLFDKYCIELYGERTCILFHINNLSIEVRLLDKIRYDKNYPVRYINKDFLYNEIPNLLKNNYTVVLVEFLVSTNTTEITSIHLPPK